MLKSKTSRLLSLVVAFVMAFGLGLSGAKNLFASASVAEVNDTLTFDEHYDYSDTFTVPADINGQHMLTLKVTSPAIASDETYNSISFTASVNRGGEYPYAEYFSYNSTLGAYYAVMDLQAREEVVFKANFDNTYGELKDVTSITAALAVGGLQIGPFSGNALYNVVVPADVTLKGVSAGNYYVVVSSADYEKDIPADATVSVAYGGETAALSYTEGMGGYSALLALNGNETLSFSATGAENFPAVNIELHGEVTAVPFGGEVSLRAGETGVYSFSVEHDGFYVLKQGGSAYTTDSGETVEADALYGFVLKDEPNYVVGDYIDVDYPLFLTAGKTYYLEISCGYAYAEVEDEEGNPVPVDNPLVATKFSFSPWAGAELVADGVTYTPVYTEGSADIVRLTASLNAGDYTVALIGAPDGVTSVTVHFGDQTLTLTGGEGFQTEKFTLNAAATEVWLTSDSQFVVGLFVGTIVPEDTITVGEGKPITLPAGGRLLCYVESGTDEPVAAGTYLVSLDGNASISVHTPTGDYAANAGEGFGLFDVDEYTASGYYLIFENLTEAEATVTATITLETHLIELDTPTEITLTDGNATYYVQHVFAGAYLMHFETESAYLAFLVNGKSYEYNGNDVSIPIELTDEEGIELPYTNLQIEFLFLEEEASFTVTLSVFPEIEE